MLYYFLLWLEATYEPPGFQIFQFITVRASLSALTALIIALFIGRKMINWLSVQQLGESVREGEDAGAVSHAHKSGTPTMGGLIILLAILGSTILWGDLLNPYVWLAVLATAWMGAFGFADDYIKTVKKDKAGLAARYKLIGQVTLGLIVGCALYFLPEFAEVRTLTHLPLVRTPLDYDVLGWFGIEGLGWLIYIPVVVFIVTGVSNAVNLTDGLDGLTTGVTAFVSAGLVALTYIAGNEVLSDFLNVLYLPGAGEGAIFAAAMTAACFGFLWFNGYPATVFMGDTGSLALGAAVAVSALTVRKELLLPIMGFIYFAEVLSVIIQTVYFKWTKKRTGTGKRVFRMAPLHHHFEARGTHEAKIVTRFWIITAVTTIATILSLRLQ
jgi:phospho-N-acetylmuramoyl-pentapeptide-transferase